jgi:hypothetical protein
LYVVAGTAVLAVLGPRISNEHGTPPRAESAAAPATPAPSARNANELSGTVRYINGLAQAVRVAGDYPVRDAILLITADTRIQVRGRPGSFDELREGDRSARSMNAASAPTSQGLST